MLLAHSSAHVIAKSTVANLSYDPIKDFVPVAPLGNLPNVLVISPEKHISTVEQLVALGKERPVTFGSIGVGKARCTLLWSGFGSAPASRRSRSRSREHRKP